MIEQDFDARTLANMEMALERACKNVPGGEKHTARRRIAKRIIRAAREGNVTLAALTEAGVAEAAMIRVSRSGSARSINSGPRERSETPPATL